ncbi:MAG: hypothetical protein Ta2D_02500 [Rickettsiales bacterium]|nr:MAG: hypothetical protein Ta2D_02500 [Rickettsiales bacterium]
MNELLINIICAFIAKKKNRHKFKEKYSKLSIFEALFLKDLIKINKSLEYLYYKLDKLDYIKNIEPYIYDNPNDKQIYPNIKILVAYHKPAQLFQHKILLPIHLGRKIAKETATTTAGTFTNNDVAVKWLLDNMIGDDTGDNISDLNRLFNEMTGIYWAWKNYDKIGNPDYIGSYHYRRLFPFDVIKDVVNYDVMMGYAIDRKISVKEWFSEYHTPILCQEMIETLKKIHTDEVEKISHFFNNNVSHYCNMFIMKKEMFFEYCEWLFPVLFEIKKNVEKIKGKCDDRDIGFCSEYLTGYFLWNKTQDKDVKCEEVEMIGI